MVIPSAAGAQDLLTLEARGGFDGFYKVNAWTPVQVTVSNQGANLRGELQIREDSPIPSATDILYTTPVDLPTQSRKQFTLYVPLRGNNRVVVTLLEEQGAAHTLTSEVMAPLAEEAFLVGVLASHPSLLNPLARIKTTDGDPVAVAHLSPDDLPTTPQAWAGLDMLVFNDFDTTQLSTAQLDALQSWVGFGGRLVVGGGPNAPQTIAGLKSLLPFSAVEIEALPHPLDSLQNLLPGASTDRGPYVAAIPVTPGGEILAREHDRPLLVSVRRGLGRVYYLALDLSLAPLDTSAGQSQFLRRFITDFRPQNGQLAPNADEDWLRDSLALIPGQTLPTPTVVCLYLCAYMLVVGPLNYIALRLVKRRELAWVTIPAIILLFSCYSYFSGFRLRGGRPMLRQITVVQAEIGAPLAAVDAFTGVYSPFRADYTLKFDQSALVESLGAEYQLGGEMTIATAGTTTVKNLRSDIGGMPTVLARSHAPAPKIIAHLRYDPLTQYVSGSVTNNTGQEITHAYLIIPYIKEDVAYDDTYVDLSPIYAAELGTLAVGETTVNNSFATSRESYSTFITITEGDDPAALDLVSRDMAMRALFNLTAYGGATALPPEAAYILGWQEGSPVGVTLEGSSNYDQMSQTLLLVGVTVAKQ
jgi:hypothetical protein